MKTTKREEVAKLCKELREDAGFTVPQLAELWDIPKSQIYRIENGRHRLKDGEVDLYSSWFKLPKDMFVCPVRTETKYIVWRKMQALKKELNIKCFPTTEIANTLGMSYKAVSNRIYKNAHSFMTEDEAKKLALYFGKPIDYFLDEPIETELPEKEYDILPEKTTKKKEDLPGITEEESDEIDKLFDTKPDEGKVRTINVGDSHGKIVNTSDTDIWKDKAHNLKKELNKALDEIEKLKKNNETNENNWKELTDSEIEQLKAENEHLMSQNRELADRYEKICAMPIEERVEYKELQSKYEQLNIAHDNHKSNAEYWKNTYLNTNAKLEMLRSAFDTKEKEMDKYKDIIVAMAGRIYEVL